MDKQMFRSVAVVEDGRSSVSMYSIDQRFWSKSCLCCSGDELQESQVNGSWMVMVSSVVVCTGR